MPSTLGPKRQGEGDISGNWKGSCGVGHHEVQWLLAEEHIWPEGTLKGRSQGNKYPDLTLSFTPSYLLLQILLAKPTDPRGHRKPVDVVHTAFLSRRVGWGSRDLEGQMENIWSMHHDIHTDQWLNQNLQTHIWRMCGRSRGTTV